MTFHRTRSALFSMSLFYKADVVVFCEGGPSLSQSDALKFSPDSRTLDTLYWSNWIHLLGLTKKFHFKSVGCKATLKSIAKDITASGCRSVSVCRDADYDILLGRETINTTPRLAFTFGYSWESDVTSVESVLRTILRFTGHPAPTEESDMIRDLKDFRSSLQYWWEIDISLHHLGKPCIFDRSKPMSPLDHTSAALKIDDNRLKARLVQIGYKRRPRRIVNVRPDESMNVAFGKLVSRSIYRYALSVIRRVIPGFNTDYENFMRGCVASTFEILSAGGLLNLKQHIKSQQLAFTT